MSVRKVKNRSGEERWEVRFYLMGRGSQRVCKRFKRKSDALAYQAKIERESHEAELFGQSALPLSQVAFKDESEKWLEHAKLRFSDSHLVRANGFFAEFLPKYGKLTLDHFTPQFMSRLQQEFKSQGAQGRAQSSNSTVNRKCGLIVAVINYSFRQGRIAVNPTRGFRKLPNDSEEMSFWEEDEARDFLSFASAKYPKGSPDRWVYLVYMVALNTGLRAGEIWGLQAQDLIPEKKCFVIKRQWNRVSSKYTLIKGKKNSRGPRSRLVPCNDLLMEELEEQIQLHEIQPDEPIFLGMGRLPRNHDGFIDRRFGPDIKSWGGKRIRFHDLRHTAATLLVARGFDIKTVKEICGHQDISTTMNYVHMVGERVKSVASTHVISPVGETQKGMLRLIK